MNDLYNDAYLNSTTEFINHIKEKSHNLLPLNGSPKNILEIGCGNGYDAIQLAEKNPLCQVTGIDIDEELISASIKNAADSKCSNVGFLLSDAEQMPFENNTFDIVRAERVFQHLKNVPAVMKEIYRVLKPGGTVSIIETDWPGMDIFIEDFSIAKKIIEILCQNVLSNGFASRKILLYFKESNIEKVDIDIFPLIMTKYPIATELIKFDHIIDIGIKNKTLTIEEKNIWLENIDFVSKNNCFNLTLNVVIYSGTKL